MENARMRSLSWDQVLAWRLRRHRLVEPAPADRLVQVAGAVCGIHAQVMATAELSLGLRVAGATRQDVRQELWERRGLVKTYGLRGTVHLFPAFGGAWPRWWTAIGEAAVRGVLCFGPNQGNRVTFVRPDQWVSGWHEDLAGSAEPTGDGSVLLLLPAFDSYVRGAYPRDQVIPPAAAARAAEGAPARTASSARSSRHRSPSPSARSTGARTCNARP
jgi:hypothetical protein